MFKILVANGSYIKLENSVLYLYSNILVHSLEEELLSLRRPSLPDQVPDSLPESIPAKENSVPIDVAILSQEILNSDCDRCFAKTD